MLLAPMLNRWPAGHCSESPESEGDLFLAFEIVGDGLEVLDCFRLLRNEIFVVVDNQFFDLVRDP